MVEEMIHDDKLLESKSKSKVKSKVSFIPGYMQQDMYDRDKQMQCKKQMARNKPT